MFPLEDCIVSEEILKEEFVCNLSRCKGACCIQGEAGAPLENSEIKILNDLYPKLKPHLRKEGIEAIESQGTSIKSKDEDLETPLIDGSDCAYSIFDTNGNVKCGIEHAYLQGDIDWRKPISCHLYPIRVQKFSVFSAVNLHRWHICEPACTLGKSLKIPAYKFLKTALIRKFSDSWYQKLEEIAEEYNTKTKNKQKNEGKC